MMAFDYAAFRAEYVRLKRRQRLWEIRDERRRANAEAVRRPTEFAAEMRARAAARRTTLTDLERRVLYYDRQYLRMTTHARGDHLTARRLLFIAGMAGCAAREVERALSRAEAVAIRCALLDQELDRVFVRRRCRARRALPVMRSQP